MLYEVEPLVGVWAVKSAKLLPIRSELDVVKIVVNFRILLRHFVKPTIPSGLDEPTGEEEKLHEGGYLMFSSQEEEAGDTLMLFKHILQYRPSEGFSLVLPKLRRMASVTMDFAVGDGDAKRDLIRHFLEHLLSV